MNFGKINVAALKQKELDEKRKKTRTGMSMQATVNSALVDRLPQAPGAGTAPGINPPQKWQG